MKLIEFTNKPVRRTILYKWEEWSDETGKNEEKQFDLEVWFRRDMLNQETATELQNSLKADEDSGGSAAMDFLAKAIQKWNLDDEIKPEVFSASLPPDLLVLIIEKFTALMTGENPTKSKS